MESTGIHQGKSASLEHMYDTNVGHFCAPVVHPVTGKTISKYHKLKDNPALKVIWNTAFGKEFGNMVQGDTRTG